MAWYYKDGEQETGPVTKAQLQALIHAKRIGARTLVRSESMPDWRPLAEMVRGGSSAAPPATPPPAPVKTPAAGIEPAASPADAAEPPPAAPAQPPALETAVCSQCGRSFPRTQVVAFDNQVICAACKPLFVQRLREGVGTPGVFRYAGFWIRLGAKIIDRLIETALVYALIIPISFLLSSSGKVITDNPKQMFSAGSLPMFGILMLISFLIPMAYNTFFIGRFGATPGKMACQIKVVTPEGSRISYLRALGRYFAELLSAIVLYIGFIMAAFDIEKRALHDRVCSTRVVHK